MNNVCQHCQKLFSTKSNLYNHQKTAKYCIEKRKNTIVVNEEHKCYCEKIFNCQRTFNRHKKTCNFYDLIIPYIEKLKNKDEQIETQNKIYLEQIETQNKIYLEQLDNKDKQIKELQDKLTSIALAGVSKSTTINNINNKILNISPLDLNDSEKLKNILESKFDTNYILDGQKGLAHFAKDHFLKDDDGNLNYVCTDPSRQTFKYKDELGDIQKDVKAKKLTKILIDAGLKEKNNTISNDWWTSYEGKINNDRFTTLQPKASEIHSISEVDNTLFVNELSAITTL